jgi:hypothetical protein
MMPLFFTIIFLLIPANYVSAGAGPDWSRINGIKIVIDFFKSLRIKYFKGASTVSGDPNRVPVLNIGQKDSAL